jgi:NAD+ synthase
MFQKPSQISLQFWKFKNEVPSDFEEHKLNLTLQTRARLRMTTLYYFAGVHGLLVEQETK